MSTLSRANIVAARPQIAGSPMASSVLGRRAETLRRTASHPIYQTVYNDATSDAVPGSGRAELHITGYQL